MPIVLRASDNQEFTIERSVAERSMLLKDMLEDLGELDEPIPLPNVSSKILEKIIEYCDHHKDAPLPTAEDDRESYAVARTKVGSVDAWDVNFFKVDTKQLFEIILAANYLHIKPLLHVGCRIVANKLKWMEEEDLRRAFNSPHYTDEEEDVIRRSESLMLSVLSLAVCLIVPFREVAEYHLA
ncbi:hypothetical protein HDU85_000005 [Gaertneriomyces sp. JEL0708]|nr:hypothetical protein HDU85_000005 [Gaertneriomyces sp. JEL0708]